MLSSEYKRLNSDEISINVYAVNVRIATYKRSKLNRKSRHV